MAEKRLLLNERAKEPVAKRVLASEDPAVFKPAMTRMGQRILETLARGEMYPAEIARAIGAHHQTVYYHVGRLEKAGLIEKVGRQKIRGGDATRFALAAGGYAVELPVKWEPVKSLRSAGRSGALARFFEEFIREGRLEGWVVVGSPLQHGESGTQARDGHYAVQLGFALGQFVSLPETFPVKLDVDVKAERLEGNNLIVVGGPRTNVIARDLNPQMPAKFKQVGFWGSIVDADGKSYGSEMDSLVVKVRNPWNPEKTCVVAAGLTGAGTKAAVIGICNLPDLLFAGYRSGDFASILRGMDRDGDGKVDSAEVLWRG